MAEPSFDPTRAVRFDLPRGSVRTERDGDRVLLVSSSAVQELAATAPPAVVEAFGRSLGAQIGKRAASSMGNPQALSIDGFVAHLSGEAAIAGVGALSVERWGRALVVVVEDSPLGGALIVPLVAAAIEAASGRRTSCALLSHDGERTVRILLGSERAVGNVREWMASGVGWSEAVVKLHGGQA